MEDNIIVCSVLYLLLCTAIPFLIVSGLHVYRIPRLINSVQLVSVSLYGVTQLCLVLLAIYDVQEAEVLVISYIAFILFQLSATSVLVHRGTCLLERRSKAVARVVLGGVLVVALVCLSVSLFGTARMGSRIYGYTAKYLLTAIYAALLALFVVPMVHHLSSSLPRHSHSSSSSTISSTPSLLPRVLKPQTRVERVLVSMCIRIALAILAYLGSTTALALSPDRSYKHVFYALQNFSAILATTVSNCNSRSRH
jgi:hypothetical membrane protein